MDRRKQRQMDKRKHPRFRTRFDTLCITGEKEGSGTLTQISYTGAFVAGSSHAPALESEVRLYVFVQPVYPFELVGRVVRSDRTGFAIEYSVDDPEIRRLVDDVAAIVVDPAS